MSRNRQQGIVLVVTLILLVVLTLFVLSSTRMTTSHLRIVGNMQGKKVVDSVAQQAIEEVLSKIGPFYKPTELITTTQTLPSGITVADVKISNRDCIRSVTAPGYSAVSGISPEDTFWNLSVEVNDSISGAKTVVTQGVRIRLPAGNCP